MKYSRDEKWWKGFRRGLIRQSSPCEVSHKFEIEKPTYKIIGEIDRLDQRDTVQSRIALRPGTPEYEEYYARHPEYKEFDDNNREILSKAAQRHFESDPIVFQLQPNVFSTRSILGTPDIVRGQMEYTPHWKSLQINETNAKNFFPEELTERIKSFALFLGVSKVRATHLKREWIYTHYAHPYSPEPYGKPVDLDYKYIICLAMRQNFFNINSGNGYLSSMEVGWRYSLISLICVTLANLIRSWGFRARALPAENSPYLVVPTFIDAGMGEQGRMGIVVTQEFGNNFRPGAVATDMPMKVDKPVDFGIQDFCDRCKICIEACPVRAIPKERTLVRGVYRWQMDAEKCRMYWSSMAHPCAICQAVCPWNFESTLFHNTIRFFNLNIPLFHKPSIWGYEILYKNTKWTPDPSWAVMGKGGDNKIKRS